MDELKIETNGVKNYECNQVITDPEDQSEQFTCEGFYVREKNTSDSGDYYESDMENVVEKMTFVNTYFSQKKKRKISAERHIKD